MSTEQAYNGELSAEAIMGIIEAMKAGVSPATMAGITADQLETIYALAHQLYQTAQFQDAEVLFKGLCCFDYSQARFWLGLAGCLQAGGRFPPAVDAYSMAAMAGGLKDPAPLYYAAVCFLKMGDRPSALGALASLEALAEESDPAQAAILSQARALAEIISVNPE